ncbi:serine/threonine protein kinase, CMGC, CDC2/CDK sub [Lodderomyces elongisporus]|uniref:serine/threonine protein kinase, CMGC, CDC2/CDK sub n=1 Tax=Lodderomyces elongisporus TaxID=36914 RepID=UPI0029269FCB|nr:serine/threonine protein kinase, CMGC, CDC2/CDK sub [Lodderomyces elongisporus]WLF79829.1 serine/threonine protein kinase, CMGC, CDC2/CDK sub [Lodderomyces elongisporus]
MSDRSRPKGPKSSSTSSRDFQANHSSSSSSSSSSYVPTKSDSYNRDHERSSYVPSKSRGQPSRDEYRKEPSRGSSRGSNRELNRGTSRPPPSGPASRPPPSGPRRQQLHQNFPTSPPPPPPPSSSSSRQQQQQQQQQQHSQPSRGPPPHQQDRDDSMNSQSRNSSHSKSNNSQTSSYSSGSKRPLPSGPSSASNSHKRRNINEPNRPRKSPQGPKSMTSKDKDGDREGRERERDGDRGKRRGGGGGGGGGPRGKGAGSGIRVGAAGTTAERRGRRSKESRVGRRVLESGPAVGPGYRDNKKYISVPKGPRHGDHTDQHSSFVQSPSISRTTSAPIATRLSVNQIYCIKAIKKGLPPYERVQQVGEGTYGKVYKAKNSTTGEYVALKRLRLEQEREGFPITAIREIKLLQSFEHRNIVGLLEMMVDHNQIYMIFDYLDHDLTGLLTHPDLNLEEGYRKFLFKQLMEGLDYLHKMRIIHRDIKGSNILLDSEGNLKIADFGLARTMKILAEGEKADFTNRVITIWYRPPELLLGATDYGREVDIWGVGCLLVELYSKMAVFRGMDEISQLAKIYNIMGTPTYEQWPQVDQLPWFEMLKPKINVAPKFQQKYAEIMTHDAFFLAEKLLSLNPKSRPTAEEALQDAYFIKDPQPEPLTFLKELKGEWHEFETKKRRREERKRIKDEEDAELAASKKRLNNGGDEKSKDRGGEVARGGGGEGLVGVVRAGEEGAEVEHSNAGNGLSLGANLSEKTSPDMSSTGVYSSKI